MAFSQFGQSYPVDEMCIFLNEKLDTDEIVHEITDRVVQEFFSAFYVSPLLRHLPCNTIP